MNKLELKSDKFRKIVKEAVEELRNNNLEKSYKTIINALGENPDAPEPHNLLGLLYERKGDYDLARKHYRAAYSLDPTYKSASVNLERVCTMFLGRKTPLDFGEVLDEDNPSEENTNDKESN